MTCVASNSACALCLKPVFNERAVGLNSSQFAKAHVHGNCGKILRIASNVDRILHCQPMSAETFTIPRNEEERIRAIKLFVGAMVSLTVAASIVATSLSLAYLKVSQKK